MLRALCFSLAVLALVIGPIPHQQDGSRSLKGIEPIEGEIGSSSFGEPGAFFLVPPPRLPDAIRTRGSWVGSDAFQGMHETGWYPVERELQILFAGYPTVPGNKLEVDLRHGDGRTEVVRYTGPDPMDSWWGWSPPIPEDVKAVRVRVVDGVSKNFSWIAFSEPFSRTKSGNKFTLQGFWLLQVLSTLCLAFTLLVGPGLFWMARGKHTPIRVATATFVGPALLTVVGLLTWTFGGVLAPRTIARVGIGAILLGMFILHRRWRDVLSTRPSDVHTVVVVTMLLAGLATAKANLSFGPQGELFAGSISRTLEAPPHSDSRISYYGIQLIAQHLSPFSKRSDFYYRPYRFTSRGPLASLVAAPIVLGLGARPPDGTASQQWIPFDHEGFAAYRITLITLSSMALWCVWGSLTLVASRRWGSFAVAVCALTPFFVHELWFTWPKIAAAAAVLIAFMNTQERRWWWAGVWLSVGFLFHPLPILSLPFLAFYGFVREAGGTFGQRAKRPAMLTAVVLSCFVSWQLASRLQHDPSGNQSAFVAYFRTADNAPATWDTEAWWESRWNNLSNTFIPFYMLNVEDEHESLNGLYRPSSDLGRASMLYWNTLPFALGLPTFLLLLAGIVLAARRHFAVVTVLLLGPALFLTIYWGAADTGMMRHCGHVVFVTFIALGVWGLSLQPDRFATWLGWFRSPWMFTYRALEVAAVSFGITLALRLPDFNDRFGVSDGFSLVAAALCLVAATRLLLRELRGPLVLSATARESVHPHPHR